MPSAVAGAPWGLLSYAICHAAHVGWWRAARPKRDIPCLAALLLLPAPALWLLNTLEGSAALVHFWLAAQYLAAYPAFQASSPTLHLLVRLDEAPPGGVTQEALVESTQRLDRGRERAASLGSLGLSRPDGSLTRMGVAFARFFLGYRKILGLGEGTG